MSSFKDFSEHFAYTRCNQFSSTIPMLFGSHFTTHPLHIVLCFSVYPQQKYAIWNHSTNLKVIFIRN